SSSLPSPHRTLPGTHSRRRHPHLAGTYIQVNSACSLLSPARRPAYHRGERMSGTLVKTVLLCLALAVAAAAQTPQVADGGVLNSVLIQLDTPVSAGSVVCV